MLEKGRHTHFGLQNLQMSRRKFPTIKQQLMMVYSLAGLNLVSHQDETSSASYL